MFLLVCAWAHACMHAFELYVYWCISHNIGDIRTSFLCQNTQLHACKCVHVYMHSIDCIGAFYITLETYVPDFGAEIFNFDHVQSIPTDDGESTEETRKCHNGDFRCW